MASQQHGFDIENDIKQKVFKLDKKYSYTAIHDIRAEDNPFDSNENISIKTTTTSTVYFGSPLRIFNYSKEEKHTAIIVILKQVENVKRIKRIVEIGLDDRDILFGEVTESEIRELENLIKHIPKNEKPKETMKQIDNLKKELNKKSGLLKFNPKIDSTTQRRLQCSIPKIEEKLNSTLIKRDSPTSVRGVDITSEIQSSKRVRNTRKNQTSLAL